MKNNPNATIAGGTGTLGVLLVWVLSLFSVEITSVIAAALTGALITITLFIGRKGLKGLFKVIWKGEENGGDSNKIGMS